MKKALFFAGIAAMTLASCSQEEVLKVNTGNADDNLVSFRVRSRNAARSVEYNTENLQDFKVFGYIGWPDEAYENGADNLVPFFKGGLAETFTRGEDGIFTSATPYYYPGDGSMLYFAAFAPTTLDPVPTPYGGFKIDEYTVNADITKQEDIILAETISDSESAAADNEITFRHALSKVYISELRCSNENLKIEVVGVKFGNIDAAGELLFCGEKAFSHEGQNEVFGEDGYIADGDGRIFWKPAGEQTSSFVYLLDAPVVLDKDNTSAAIMSGDDAATENATHKEAFMMIPQQLKATLEENEEGTEIQKFYETDSYIAFLIRVTTVSNDKVIYPFAEGVTNITEEIGGVKYAWAAFPVASLWAPGLYVDYLVDFSKGVGFVAPGAEDHVLKPILGTEVTFTVSVGTSGTNGWNQGGLESIEHDNTVRVDIADDEDPFPDDNEGE
ncbi:MAG: fimbrillin family protein [Muribaculaceae bacterium]|nr:fimbrillin family protein [Muribaculaceae bacterium]